MSLMRGVKLFGQCPYRTNTFQKRASLNDDKDIGSKHPVEFERIGAGCEILMMTHSELSVSGLKRGNPEVGNSKRMTSEGLRPGVHWKELFHQEVNQRLGEVEISIEHPQQHHHQLGGTKKTIKDTLYSVHHQD